MTTVAGEKQRELNKLFDELMARHNGYRCVKCHRQPWPAWSGDTHQLRCACGPDFDGRGGTLEPAGNWMKEKLANMIERQTQVGGAMVIHDHETALARATEANIAGLWPQTATPQQLQLIAKAALAYGLDPLMGELILYQGKPFIGIDGRRRLDSRAGHHPSIKFRPLTAEEKEWFTEAGSMEEGDLAGYCILEDRNTNQVVEGFGKVTKAQREEMRTKQGGGTYKASPVLSAHPIEMFEKRCETRARKMAYGPNPIPAGLEGIMGDDEQIIEGEGRMLDNEAISPPPAPEPEPTSAPSHPELPIEPEMSPESAPVPKGTPSQELEDLVAAADMTWEEFELQVLRCTWDTFIKVKGASSDVAITKLNTYLEQQQEA